MEKVLTHKRYYESKIENISHWKVTPTEKDSVRRFIKDYENGKITGRIGTNPAALIERLLDYLRIGLENLKDGPSSEDVEAFFQELLKDKIRFESYNKEHGKKNSRPYALRSKKAIFDALSKYLKWKYPERPELLQPLSIKIKAKKHEPDSLSVEEIDRLYRGCKNESERYLIAILFSSGARAEEFHNIRYSDIELPKGEDAFIKIRLRTEFSKTEGRTIALYYHNAIEAVREYLEMRKQEGIKPEDPVFAKGYRSGKDTLSRLGKRALNRPINYHLFRHSCATWLADRLNRQQLCIFFGWKFSSSMPDVYIQRKGVEMKDIDVKFQRTAIESLKDKLAQREYEANLRTEELDALTGKLKELGPLNESLRRLMKSPKFLKLVGIQ